MGLLLLGDGDTEIDDADFGSTSCSTFFELHWLGEQMTPIRALEEDIAKYDVELPESVWGPIRRQLVDLKVKSGDCIYGQHAIGDRWLFLASGIAASRQTLLDGSSSIARFFECGQFCANLTSTWTRDYAADDLIAITDVLGVELPDRLLRTEYIQGGPFGEYLRFKVMETLCFDKEIICVKTSANTEARYSFLERHHKAVVGNARQKDIAAFLGVTPQGLSRFLKKRNGSS